MARLPDSIFCLIFMVHSITTVNRAVDIPLSEGWTVTDSNQSIKIQNQRIPSGVYSALENANITESVLHSYNDVDLRWIGKDDWKYSLGFNIAEDLLNHSQILLVFHGLDTIADITLNGFRLLPSPHNMFVRYRYDIREILITTHNRLEILFHSPIEMAKKYAKENKYTPPECPNARYHGECHMNQLRKMQASFSWDWGLAAPSVGIWKPVVLEVYDTVIIRDVTYRLRSFNDKWKIDLSVYLESGVGSQSPRSFEGYLYIDLMDVPNMSFVKHVLVSRTKEDSFKENVSIDVPKNLVERWWPNGLGNQTLYKLNVTWIGENRNIFTNEITQTPMEYLHSEKVVRVGFRTIELREDPTSDGTLFYFKVNNVPVFMKGTNFIPSDILPEKSFDKEKIEYLILSTKEANMNSIRVWGGGVYESDYFYDLADEHGILIWQDMMFACSMYPVYPSFLQSVEEEIAQNIRRLQSHPSIFVWNGNNENEAALVQNWFSYDARFSQEFVQLYKDVVEKAVRENDQWHVWLYSSPSNGENSSVIDRNPMDYHRGDIHYYNYNSDLWNSNIFPKARFISEYGYQSFPSEHSIRRSMKSEEDIDEIINHRQHYQYVSGPIISMIAKHLNLPSESSNIYWEPVIYFSQKSVLNFIYFRVGRYFDHKTMGALYFVLNEVWTAPSWSSIEYNGNFKILHYWVKEFFAPIHVVANLDVLNNLNVFVVRDTLGQPLSLNLHMRVYDWSSLRPISQQIFNISMAENSVDRIIHKPLKEISNQKANKFLYFGLTDAATGDVIATNFLLLEKLKDSQHITNPHLQYDIFDQRCDRKTSVHRAVIQINVSAPAIFVYIKINNLQIETYKLSKNGFIQLTSKDLVTISFYNRNCAMAFTNDDIKILTVNDFLTT